MDQEMEEMCKDIIDLKNALGKVQMRLNLLQDAQCSGAKVRIENALREQEERASMV